MFRISHPRLTAALMAGLFVLVLVGAGCLPPGKENTSQLPKQVGDPRISSNIEQVARIDGLTPEQNAVLAQGIYEGIIDKIDPTWTDKSDVNNELFVTDLLIKVTKTHKGPNLNGKIVVVRVKQTHQNKKFEDVLKLKFDSPVLVHILNDAKNFVTTTGEFSSAYVLNLIVNDDSESKQYKDSLAAVASAKKLTDQQREELVKELDIQPELLTAILASK